jgi:hypothetical protein
VISDSFSSQFGVQQNPRARESFFSRRFRQIKMIRKLAVSITMAMLLFVLVPQARPDSTTVSVEEILAIPPLIVDGAPAQATVDNMPDGIYFVGQGFDIGYSWGALQQTSMASFGVSDAQITTWDSSMSFVGCAWGQDCAGTVYLGSGVSGTGFMNYTPHYAYMAIDSLTYSTPEPSSLLLLGSGLLGLVGFYRRRITVCP